MKEQVPHTSGSVFTTLFHVVRELFVTTLVAALPEHWSWACWQLCSCWRWPSCPIR